MHPLTHSIVVDNTYVVCRLVGRCHQTDACLPTSKLARNTASPHLAPPSKRLVSSRFASLPPVNQIFMGDLELVGRQGGNHIDCSRRQVGQARQPTGRGGRVCMTKDQWPFLPVPSCPRQESCRVCSGRGVMRPSIGLHSEATKDDHGFFLPPELRSVAVDEAPRVRTNSIGLLLLPRCSPPRSIVPFLGPDQQMGKKSTKRGPSDGSRDRQGARVHRARP